MTGRTRTFAQIADDRIDRWKPLTKEQRNFVHDCAAREASERLRPGDRLRVSRCGNGGGVTVTFTEWDGRWACSAKLIDISPVNILAINGEVVDFCAYAFRKLDA